MGLILITVCALTVSLATRYYTPPPSQNHAVKAVERGSLDAKRQHLNKDATQWVEPAANFTTLQPAAVNTSVVLADLQLPKLRIHQHPYNRPPPASVLSL